MSAAPIQVARQRRAAIDLANEVRLRRAREKHAIDALPRVEGAARVACLILAPPAWLQSCPLGELLTWPHRVGDRAAAKILTAAMLSPFKPVGQLTERQRRLVAAAVTKERPLYELTWAAG